MNAPQERKPGELVFTALLLIASAFLLWHSYGISGLQSVSSAGMFPMLAALTMLVTGCQAMVAILRRPRAEALAGTTAWSRFVSAIAPPELIAGAVAVFAYMALLEVLGFLVASYLFLLLCMRLFGGRRWMLNAVVSALCLAAIHLIFQTVFSVVLPKGTLWAGVV